MVNIYIYEYFYRAASTQSGLSHELNVPLSGCLFVKCVNCDKMKETYAHILIPYDRRFI